MQSPKELMNKRKNKVFESSVIVVKDIDIVPPQLAMACYYYCEENTLDKNRYFRHVALGGVLIVLIIKPLVKYFDCIELETRLDNIYTCI